MNRKNMKKAFTLAEVLITLGIIGVVAEMTIPVLMNNVDSQVFKSSYKVAYSTMTQALLKANSEDLIQDRTAWCGAPESLSNWNAFKSEFKVMKECPSGSPYLNECWAAGEQAYASGSPPGVPSGGESFFVDASGMEWMYHSCFYYLVDTNGLKKPNKYGRDRFMFTFTPNSSVLNAFGGPLNQIGVLGDISAADPNFCPSAQCYYQSWLFN